MAAQKVVNTSGKRKTAIAKASVTKGSGSVRINKVPLELYSHELARSRIEEPIILAGKKAQKLDINVSVQGGGVMGQADAIRTAIARGILEFTGDEKLEEIFKEYDRKLLVNDPRRKMPKKPLGRGARKMRQKSYR